MRFTKTDKFYFLRFDKGEDVIPLLKQFCFDYKIFAGFFTAIGAVDEVSLGLFDTRDKTYYAKTLKDLFEVVSFTGNVSEMNGEAYIHAHAVVSNRDLQTFGGHANKAVVSATFELVLCTDEEGFLTRYFDADIGLNLFDFPKQ